MKSLEGLDARHFISTHDMRACCGERWRRFIHLTDRADLLGPFRRIVSGWGEPVALAMGV